MPIYPYSFQLPPLNVQDIPNDGAPGEFLGINVGGALDWLPAGGGGSGDMLAANNLSELTNFATARTNIGLGTASAPTFANLTLTSPSLSSSAPVTISQTWGTLNATYTAFKVVANEAAVANTASNMLELWSGNAATLKVRVNKDGSIFFPSGQSIGNSNTAFVCGGGNFYPAGTLAGTSTLGTVGVPFAGIWLGTSNQSAFLASDSLNTLALRNGAAAQTFNIYNTYQNAGVDYERIAFKWSANLFTIGREFGGTGGARNINIIGGGSVLGIGSAATAAVSWTFFNNNLLAGTDNTYNIGANGASRPQNIFVGQTVRANAFQLNSLSHIYGTVEGIIGLYNNALSDFNRLQFGGTTNLFPAIKRNAAGLQIRLADDSANATLEAGNLYASGNVGIGTTSPTSNLHVAGNSSPAITVENTVATGYSELRFKNTVTTGSSIFLNGSAQSGYGGASSLNIYSISGPLAFHTASVTNALSIAQSGVATFSTSVVVNSAIRTGFINNIGDSISMFSFVNDTTGTSTYALGGSAPLMRFGGITTSFPAIKRSATTLQIRLANDSDFAPIQGKLTTETAFTATTVTPTGFITLYDSTGAAHKVPCVPV